MSRIQELARQPAIKEALDAYASRLPQIVDLAIAIQQIPGATFHEKARADFVQAQFEAIGLEHVFQDSIYNVYGRLGGVVAGDPLVISAHTDTVFPPDTDLSCTRDEERVYGPGIADNSMGVAALLTIAQTLKDLGIDAEREVWFVANVGEEGLGDLRGMRAVVDHFQQRGRYIVLEGGLLGYICHEAIGVRRYRVKVEGPGGHSWGSFGTPSAIHLLGRLIARISALKPPHDPKTTFNVGVIEGGTTVNTIAREASMLLDLRSEAPGALAEIVQQVETIVRAENGADEMQVWMEPIGNRPAGRIGRRTRLVRWATDALCEAGLSTPEYTMASTDANVPLSLGLQAVCIGVTRSGHTHRPDEYMEVEPIATGLKQATLLALAASGKE